MILLTSAAFLTDEGVEGYEPDVERMVLALLDAADRLLGAAPGTFPGLAHVLGGG